MDVIVNMVTSCVFTGGVIIDSNDKFMSSFMVPLKFFISFTVELWAIYYGLKFVWIRCLPILKIYEV